MGMQLDAQKVYAENEKKTDVTRKNGCIINTQGKSKTNQTTKFNSHNSIQLIFFQHRQFDKYSKERKTGRSQKKVKVVLIVFVKLLIVRKLLGKIDFK